jgi:hypothetical protein
LKLPSPEGSSDPNHIHRRQFYEIYQVSPCPYLLIQRADGISAFLCVNEAFANYSARCERKNLRPSREFLNTPRLDSSRLSKEPVWHWWSHIQWNGRRYPSQPLVQPAYRERTTRSILPEWQIKCVTVVSLIFRTQVNDFNDSPRLYRVLDGIASGARSRLHCVIARIHGREQDGNANSYPGIALIAVHRHL